LRLLCAFLALAPQLASADAAQDLKNRIDRIQDLKGQFKQVLRDKTGAALQTSSGEFALKRPGYFLWESAAPYEQTVIGTPEKVWVYDPDLEQVTVRRADEQAADNPARLLSGDLAALRSNYEVTAQGANYHLEPKSGDSPYRYIEFNFRDETLAGLNFKDKLDQETRIDFDGLQLNTNISAAIFVFTPPQGVDVIESE
jgi:outer membrane lipoprotein carrier protein